MNLFMIMFIRHFRIDPENAHYFRHVRFSECISAATVRRIYIKFDIGHFYENLSRQSELR